MSLLLACALTVAIETLFFLLVGWRDRQFLLLCVSANVLTNLSMNLLILLLARFGLWHRPLALPLELCVVAAEYAIYAIVRQRGGKLLLLTLAANVLSCSVGLLIPYFGF